MSLYFSILNVKVKLKILKLNVKNEILKMLTVGLVKFNNIGGSWVDLGVHVVVSPVLHIFLETYGGSTTNRGGFVEFLVTGCVQRM
jgi:hypothetical protein